MSSAAKQGARTVLIVEDDAATAELERRALMRAGASVRIVGGVSEALEALEQERFAAILLDYQLPDGDPWSVVERAGARIPRIPVIIATAMGNERVAAEAVRRGIADYVVKTASFYDALAGVVDRATRLAATEERLRHSDALFQMIARHARDMVATADGSGAITSISPACRNLLGYEPDELIGKAEIDLLHPEDRAGSAAARMHASSDSQMSSVARYRRKDGTYVWTETNSYVARDAVSARPVEVIAIVRDITERKRAQQALERALEEKTTLLQEVHHRVRNNLQIISSLLSLQATYSANPHAKGVLAVSQTRIRAIALVHQLLYEEHNFAGVHLGRYLERLAKLITETAALSRREVLVRVIGTGRNIQVDMQRAIPCGLIVNELVTNAFKHAFPDGACGEVCIELNEQAPGEVIVTVRDNGIGLPNDFDLTNAKSLGLQLLSHLADQLGASVRRGEAPGARFDLRFPASAGQHAVHRGETRDYASVAVTREVTQIDA